MTRFAFFCSLVLLIQTYSFGQTEVVEATAPDGSSQKMEFPLLRNLEMWLKQGDVYPHILITNTEYTDIHELYAADFQAILSAQEALYQYRYLQSFALNDWTYGNNGSFQSQMYAFRKTLNRANLIPSILEHKLQLKLEEYFEGSQCYAYNIQRLENQTLTSIGKAFKTDITVSPQILIIDTTANQLITTLQFDVYFKGQDSVVTRNIKHTGNNLEEAIEYVTNACSQYILSSLFRNEKSREIAKLAKLRASALRAQLHTDERHPSQQGLDTIRNTKDKLGFVVSEEDDKVITLYLRPYSADFEENLKDVFINNPYPNIDVKTFRDPEGISYLAEIYTSFKHQNQWIHLLHTQVPIHSTDVNKAKEQVLMKIAKLRCFAPANPHKISWIHGAFSPIDTAILREEAFSTSDSLVQRQLYTVANNRVPYQGLPETLVKYLDRYTFKERRAFADSLSQAFLQPAFQKLARHRLHDFRIVDEKKNGYWLIHNQERTKALIPVFVEEPYGRTYLRFFYWEASKPNALCEWTYLDKYYLNHSLYYKELIVSQMNKAVAWNFGYHSLNNDSFWEHKVLAREQNKPKYLTPLDVPKL
jgi:hypothetical protein